MEPLVWAASLADNGNAGAGETLFRCLALSAEGAAAQANFALLVFEWGVIAGSCQCSGSFCGKGGRVQVSANATTPTHPRGRLLGETCHGGV